MPPCGRGELPGPREEQGLSGSVSSRSVSGPPSSLTTPSAYRNRLSMKDSSSQKLHSSLGCYCSFNSAKKDTVWQPLCKMSLVCSPVPVLIQWLPNRKKITLKSRFLVSGSVYSRSSYLPKFPALSLLCHAKRINADNIFKQMWTKILTSSPAICLLSSQFLHVCKQPQWVQPATVWHLIMFTLTELHKTNSSYS